MASDAEQSSWLVNTTDDTFDQDVFVRSQTGLVVVDFWAEWCAPCRLLGPVLEKLAEEYAGRFTLVKANTDATQQAAGGFGISGIPAVFGVLDGEIVDSFQGALPEESIRLWLDRLLLSASLVEAKQLCETAPEEAEMRLRELLAASPNDSAAAIVLADLLLKQGRDDECQVMIEKLEQRGFLESSAERIKAQLDLNSKVDLDVETTRAAAAAAPDDFGLQLKLAEALAGEQQYQEACEICLTLVSLDRAKTGEKARELMVEIFRVLPDDSELTSEYRRKLSMALY